MGQGAQEMQDAYALDVSTLDGSEHLADRDVLITAPEAELERLPSVGLAGPPTVLSYS
jgi:hypothetical protein